MEQKTRALEAIQKKLVGKTLNYKEIFSIMDEISHERLGTILTTYFAASGYSNGFNADELFYLTKAMVETGDRLYFDGIVADKHSIGGVPGTRTTMIVVPLIAAAGFTIPKSSSRAITTPGGTADDMEVLSPVEFNKKQIYEIVKKANACIVWGGGVDIAPADDIIIKVESPLMHESFDKILVSIMAKKIAFGSTHVVIDLPYGKFVKAHRLKDAEVIRKKFEQLARRFGIKIRVLVHKTDEPAGRGIGPVLETRDALRVLEQTPDRPLDLEKRALNLTATLLDLCLSDSSKELQEEIKNTYKSTYEWAETLLQNGQAAAKMREIIAAQGGNPHRSSTDLTLGKYTYDVKATSHGEIKQLHSKNLSILAKILGAPKDKKAGLYLHKKKPDHIKKGENIFTLYSSSETQLQEAVTSLANFPIFIYD
jgi:putative thymidine phosphorylase